MPNPVMETLLSSFVGLVGLAATSNMALAAGIQGVWLTGDKDAALTIASCGSQLCGRIVWLESATDQSGSPRLDRKNPDPAKRTHRICGLVVITNLKPSGPDTWEGSVYNPQDGQTYSGEITVLSEKTLEVQAYIGLPIFGRSQIWTRANVSGANDIDYKCRNHGSKTRP
jgi:uncharacterized protein (DUF2147 family)